MTDVKTAVPLPGRVPEEVRKKAHEKNLEYDPTQPKETEQDKRQKELNKRREEEYKRDAKESQDQRPTVEGGKHGLTPQSQGPGQGIAPDRGPHEGQSQEEIESPVQAMRDPRLDQETTNVDSGGDKLLRRGGLPASIEEKKAWGDYIPPGPAPFSGGVPGAYRPGELPPTLEERTKEAEQLQAMREGRPVTSQPQPGANVKEANKAAEKAAEKAPEKKDK